MGCTSAKIHASNPIDVKPSNDIEISVTKKNIIPKIIVQTERTESKITEEFVSKKSNAPVEESSSRKSNENTEEYRSYNELKSVQSQKFVEAQNLSEKTSSDLSNTVIYQDEYLKKKMSVPDIDLTPADDKAFSLSICQQRQTAIDNISYRRTIDQWQPNSYEQLIDSIKILSRNKNEIEQAWIIFYWISMNIRYDTDAYFSNSIGSQASSSVFLTKKAVCEGYSTLYADLCTRIGLQCHKVNGYAKGYSFNSRQTTFKETNHAWNIISLKNGHSYFIESTWGSGHLDSSTNKYKIELVPHYFLCRPEHMIYGHLPVDPQWQLLKRPLTMEQYLMLPCTNEIFFQLNLHILSPLYTSKVTLMKGKSYGEILLSTPSSDVELSGTLSDDSGKRIEGGDFIYFDMDKNVWRCHFAPQKAGNHNILIFGRKKTDTTKLTSASAVEFTFDIDQLPTKPISYPHIWSDFFDYHLEIVSPINTRYIKWPSDKNIHYCEIYVRSPNDVYISTKIADSVSGKSIENGSLANYDSQESLWQCLFAPSNSHTSYKLTLFARRLNENQSKCVIQFDLKQYDQSTRKNYISLPATYALFQEAKCHLYEPLNGILKRGSKINFRCRIPNAREINITVDGQWLENVSSACIAENHLYQREIQVGQKEVIIWVKFDKEKSSYAGLLKYLVE